MEEPLMERREFVVLSTSVMFGAQAPRLTAQQRREGMYGIIGKIIAVEGSREALAAILLDGVANMPGCSSYIVATDTDDPDALWVTEVWDDEASHQASLSLPSVEEAIRKGRPLIAGFGERFVTEPLGGHGLG
jgi:quinol monooxygenase YgiN